MATLMSRTGRFSRPVARDPFASLHEEVNQLINEFFDGHNGGDLPTVLSPSIDLSETDDAYLLQMDLPGVDARDIDIELRANSVTVCGERKAEEEQEGRSFHRTERQWGRFCRTIQLPGDVESEKVEAECSNGILTVTLPKSGDGLTKRVPVKSPGV